MLAAGDTIDRYEVQELIGSGGTAVVYRVKHTALGTEHALKVLSVTSPVIRDRMLTEGRVQASLRHLNVVAVTDVLDVNGAPGLLMEHIEGPSLEAALDQFQIPLTAAESLFIGIVNGMRQAHHHGLVHRDLKPANVLLASTPDGFVPKVTDFGLAKVIAEAGAVSQGHTRAGVALGTPAYMAPEQIRDARKVDQRADVFALGCILYELVCKQRVYPGTDTIAIYNAVLDAEFVLPRELVPDVPDRIENAILGALVQDKAKRIPDCDTLLAVLAGTTVWEIPPRIEGFRPQTTEEHGLLAGISSPPKNAPVLTMAAPSTLDIADEPHQPDPVRGPAPVEDDLADLLELPPETPAPAPVAGDFSDVLAPATDVHSEATSGAPAEHDASPAGAVAPLSAEAPLQPMNPEPGDLQTGPSLTEELELLDGFEGSGPPSEDSLVSAASVGPSLDPADDDLDLYPGRTRKLPWVIGGAIALVAFLFLLGIGGAVWMGMKAMSGSEAVASPTLQPTEVVDVAPPVAPDAVEPAEQNPVPEPQPAEDDVPTRRIGEAQPDVEPTQATRPAPAVVQPERSQPERSQPAPRPQPVAAVQPTARPEPAPRPAPVVAQPTPPPAPAAPVEVKILSMPPTASFTVAGQSGLRTPSKLELEPGRHSVTLTSGDRTERVSIRPTTGGENVFCYSFPESRLYTGRCP